MTPEQEEHLQEIKDFFVAAVDIKYRKGQAEHGGNLWDRNVTLDVKDEAIDLVTYIVTELAKKEALTHLVEETITELNTHKNLIFAKQKLHEILKLLK